MPVNQAKRDLKEKLIFERQLLRKINAFNRRIAKALVREFELNKTILRAEQFRSEIETILLKHYKKVGKEFGNRLTEDMPSDIPVTTEERKTIEGALNIFYLAQVGEQANIITRTNQDNIDAAFAEAREQEEVEEQQKAFTVRQIAVIAATNLVRKLTGRSSSIAAYETQIIAETAKGVEGQVLSGQDPSVLVGTSRSANVKKEWVTMGDQLVRDAHIAADGEVVDVNEPFIVDGEQLMYPGDASMGASAGNIIHCRCASVIDKENVYAERRKSKELLESIRESL